MAVLTRTLARPKQRREKANLKDESDVAAPTSGKVVRVLVQDQDRAAAGDVLLALTAMKMVGYSSLSPFLFCILSRFQPYMSS
jgi:biotin carboxyl carrier protein